MDFKKEYKGATFDYKKGDTNVRTDNQQLTDDIKGTIRSWNKQYRRLSNPKDFKAIFKLNKGSNISYVSETRKMEDGKWVRTGLVARKGGFINSINEDKKYITLTNPTIRNNGKTLGWSIQFDPENERVKSLIKFIWVREEAPDEKVIEETKEEEEASDDENDDAQKERPDKLTAPQRRLLRKLYYDKYNLVGRDKLYKLVRGEEGGAVGKTITRTMVEHWLKAQVIHQITAPRKRNVGTKSIISTNKRNIMSMDLVDFTFGSKKAGSVNDQGQELGRFNSRDGKLMRWLLVYMDIFTKKAWVEPLENKKADTVLAGLKRIIAESGKPKTIIADNEFKSGPIKDYLTTEGIKLLNTQPHSPWQNPVERLNGTLKRNILALNESVKVKNGEDDDEFIRAVGKKPFKWLPYLRPSVYNYNRQYHKTIRMTPNQAEKPENRDEVLANIRKSKESPADNFDDYSFEVGDKVRLALRKQGKHAKGIRNWSRQVYVITRKIKASTLTNFNYRLRKLGGKATIRGAFNSSQLLLVPENTDIPKDQYGEDNPEDLKPADLDDNEGLPEVFVDTRTRRGKKEIRIKWRGWEAKHNTWEPEKNLIKDLGKDVFDILFKAIPDEKRDYHEV